MVGDFERWYFPVFVWRSGGKLQNVSSYDTW
jgi:hypothetical protein